MLKMILLFTQICRITSTFVVRTNALVITVYPSENWILNPYLSNHLRSRCTFEETSKTEFVKRYNDLFMGLYRSIS